MIRISDKNDVWIQKALEKRKCKWLSNGFIRDKSVYFTLRSVENMH